MPTHAKGSNTGSLLQLLLYFLSIYYLFFALFSFLTQIVCLCTERLAADIQCSHLHHTEYEFSLQQLSLLLLFISHMLQSGNTFC